MVRPNPVAVVMLVEALLEESVPVMLILMVVALAVRFLASGGSQARTAIVFCDAMGTHSSTTPF